MRSLVVRCLTTKSARGPTSSSTPAGTYPQLRRRSGIFSLVCDSAPGNNRPVREVIFDTETTGLNPLSGDRMVEIGCVEIYNRVETGRHFHCYFNPDREMPFEAEAVHGLSTIFLSDKPRFSEKVGELLEFIQDSPLIAHNASFDFGFLNFELQHCGHPCVSLQRMVDTLTLARSRHPGAKHSLDA